MSRRPAPARARPRSPAPWPGRVRGDAGGGERGGRRERGRRIERGGGDSRRRHAVVAELGEHAQRRRARFDVRRRRAATQACPRAAERPRGPRRRRPAPSATSASGVSAPSAGPSGRLSSAASASWRASPPRARASASSSCNSRVCARQRGVRSAGDVRRQRPAARRRQCAVRRAAALRREAPRMPATRPALPAARSRRARANRRGSSARESSGNSPRGSRDQASASRGRLREIGIAGVEELEQRRRHDMLRAAALRADARPSPMMAARRISVGRLGSAASENSGCSEPALGWRPSPRQAAATMLACRPSRALISSGAAGASERRPRPQIAMARNRCPRWAPRIARERGARRADRRVARARPAPRAADRAPPRSWRSTGRCAAPPFPARRRSPRWGRGAHPSRERCLLVADREPHQRRRRVAVAQHADEIDDRSLRGLVGLGDDLEQRTQHAAAERDARIIHVRVAVHRRQKPLEQRRQQPAACRRVLAGRKRVRELRFEIGQSASQVGELQRQTARLGDGFVVVRRAQQLVQRIRRLLLVAAANEQPRERERRRRIRVVRDGRPVGRDRLLVRASARLQFADACQRLRIRSCGSGRRVRQGARHVMARERDVGDLQVGFARPSRRQPRDVIEARDGFVELARPLEQVDQRESRLDGDVAGGVIGRAHVHARQQILQRRDRARRIAHALLGLRQKERDLRVVGVGTRVLAQLADLRVDARASLTHQEAQQPHPGLAPAAPRVVRCPAASGPPGRARCSIRRRPR